MEIVTVFDLSEEVTGIGMQRPKRKNTIEPHVHECSTNLRGNLMHDLGGGVFQCVLQVVLEVAEELPSSSLHHIQQSSTIVSIHIWGQRTIRQSASRGKHSIHGSRHSKDANRKGPLSCKCTDVF